MLADLDLLLTAVFAAADDLLPEPRRNARRSVTDAEVVTLAVAQAIMDVPSDREFLALARHRLGHLFRGCRASRAIGSAAGAAPSTSTG